MVGGSGGARQGQKEVCPAPYLTGPRPSHSHISEKRIVTARRSAIGRLPGPGHYPIIGYSVFGYTFTGTPDRFPMARNARRELAAKQFVGQRIRAARRAAGLSQARLAAAIGWPQGVISEWESGQRRPGQAATWELARALGTTVQQLLGEPSTSAEQQQFDALVQRLHALANRSRDADEFVQDD